MLGLTTDGRTDGGEAKQGGVNERARRGKKNRHLFFCDVHILLLGCFCHLAVFSCHAVSVRGVEIDIFDPYLLLGVRPRRRWWVRRLFPLFLPVRARADWLRWRMMLGFLSGYGWSWDVR